MNTVSLPTLKQLNDGQSFDSSDGSIFVNYNRRLQPFIRVNRYPSDTKTFPLSRRGYEQAIAYFTGGVRHGGYRKP